MNNTMNNTMNTMNINTKRAKAISTAISKDKHREALQHLYVDAEGNMAATDGARLHMSNKASPAPRSTVYALLGPKVVKTLRGKEFALRFDGDSIDLNSTTMPRNEGNWTFPDFRRVIPSVDGDYQCICTDQEARRELVKALRKLGKDTQLTMTIGKEEVLFTSGSHPKTKVEITIPELIEVGKLWQAAFDMLPLATEDTHTRFNSTFLADALDLSAAGCTVHFREPAKRGFNKGVSEPMHVDYDDGCFAIVMPLRDL